MRETECVCVCVSERERERERESRMSRYSTCEKHVYKTQTWFLLFDDDAQLLLVDMAIDNSLVTLDY